MPTDVSPFVGPVLTTFGVIVVALLTLMGAKRGAKANEKMSIDDLTKELIVEYRTMKQELRADMESRLTHEREERQRLVDSEKEERRRMQEAFDRRFNELLASSKYLEKYVLWCVAGHKPPPQEVPHKALEKLKNLYPKGSDK